jgi:hypothetical protein
MNCHQFQALLPQFEQVYEKRERQRKRKVVRTGKKRLRGIGGGAQFENSLCDRLLMLLFYYRLYLTQEFMTLLFRAEHKSVICRALQLMRPVFESVLPVPERARRRVLELANKEQKRRQKRIGTVDEFRQAYPEQPSSSMASSSPSANLLPRPSARAIIPERRSGTRANNW